MFLSNEMKCSLQCRRQIFMSLSFFAEKVILELNCTKSLFVMFGMKTSTKLTAVKIDLINIFYHFFA